MITVLPIYGRDQGFPNESVPVAVDKNGVVQVSPASGSPAEHVIVDSGTITANAGSGTLLVDGSAHTQPVSGSVSVSNFPATQPISGSVSVSNFPAVQPVTRVGATLNTNQVSIGSTSTLIIAANANRKRLVLINMGTTNVFIGNTGVTIGTGQLLLGIAGYVIPLYFTGAVYGIVGTGTQTIAYLEEAV